RSCPSCTSPDSMTSIGHFYFAQIGHSHFAATAHARLYYTINRTKNQEFWSFGGVLTPDYTSFGLKDKIAIVTGPSQGIGRAIALGLARAGAHVVLAKHPANRHEEARALKAEIEGLGRQALLVMTDVSLVADIRAMVRATQEAFGRLDIL